MSDRSKYSSALPWFRIVLKQRDFASFGRMGIARKIERAGETAGLSFSVHVHMLRHSTGYALAAKGKYVSALKALEGDEAAWASELLKTVSKR